MLQFFPSVLGEWTSFFYSSAVLRLSSIFVFLLINHFFALLLGHWLQPSTMSPSAFNLFLLHTYSDFDNPRSFDPHLLLAVWVLWEPFLLSCAYILPYCHMVTTCLILDMGERGQSCCTGWPHHTFLLLGLKPCSLLLVCSVLGVIFGPIGCGWAISHSAEVFTTVMQEYVTQITQLFVDFTCRSHN